MSSNGKSALSGDSSSEKPKGVQAESYSIDTPCVSSSHSIGDPYSKQAKVVVSVSSGLTKLCVLDSKKPLFREMFDKWEAQKWWGENSLPFLLLRKALDSICLLGNLIGLTKEQIDDPSLYHITVQKKSETSEENQKKKKSKIREGNQKNKSETT
ncbi:hypothetical protein Bca101_031091 [Brassica carinata]